MPEAAERTIAWLDAGTREGGRGRLRCARPRGARATAARADAVLNATDYPFNLDVMRAALDARVPTPISAASST